MPTKVFKNPLWLDHYWMGTQPLKGAQPPIFGPCVLWSDGWMHQDATWYGGRARPRPHCVRWDPAPPKMGQQPPIFGPRLLWPNGWMDQDATWCGGRPELWQHCIGWGPSPHPKSVNSSRHFSAHVYCGQAVAHLSYC